MHKLPCGCTPDASGYGYCSECVQKLRKKIWLKMDEKRRKYDRYFAPKESAALDAECCSCHINPPCPFCLSRNEEKVEEL